MMRPLFAILLLVTPPAAFAHNDTPDVALARALAGLRPAGAPQACISLREAEATRIIDDGTIVYRGTGRAYVNRPPGGCPGLKPDRVLLTRTPSDRLCRGDIVTILDRLSPTAFGSCALGAFEPYARQRP